MFDTVMRQNLDWDVGKGIEYKTSQSVSFTDPKVYPGQLRNLGPDPQSDDPSKKDTKCWQMKYSKTVKNSFYDILMDHFVQNESLLRATEEWVTLDLEIYIF